MDKRGVRGCGLISESEKNEMLLNGLQMLNSVQGMVERTRQSLASLKDRVHSTHAEMERKEVSNVFFVCVFE